MKVLQALQTLLKEDIYEADYQYARYDMYSDRHIIESVSYTHLTLPTTPYV